MKILARRILPPGDPSRFVLWRWMTITDPDGNLYLDRLYIFRCPWFGLMRHHIAAADFDRTPHNHPWGLTKKSSFWSYVAKGGYVEELETMREQNLWDPPKKFLVDQRVVTHKARHWHAFGLDDVHRITHVEPNTITYVVSGRKRSGWGFWIEEDGFGDIVSWRDYLDSQGRNGNGAR